MKLNILLLAILLAFCLQVYANDVVVDNGMGEEEEEIDISSEDKTSQFVMASTATSTIPKTKPSKTIPTDLVTPTTTILPDTTVSDGETLTKTTVTFEYDWSVYNYPSRYGSIVTYLPEDVDDAFVLCSRDIELGVYYSHVCEMYGEDCFFKYEDFQYESTRPCRIYTTRALDTKPSYPITTSICRKFDELTTSLSSRSFTYDFEKVTIDPETVHFLSKGFYSVNILTVDKYTSCVSSATSTSTSRTYTTTSVVTPEYQKVTTVNFVIDSYTYTSAVMTVPKTVQGPIAARCITNFNNAYPYWKKREIKIDTSDRVVARAFSTKTIPSVSVNSTSSKVVIQSETTTSASSRVKTIPSSSGTLRSETTTSTSGTIRVKTIPSSSGTLKSETTTTTTITTTTSSSASGSIRVKTLPKTTTSTRRYEPPNFPQQTNTVDTFIDQFGNYYDYYNEYRNTIRESMYHTTCRLFTTASKPIIDNNGGITTHNYCYVTANGKPTTYYRYISRDLNTYTGPITDTYFIKTVISTEISTLHRTTTYSSYCAKSIPTESLGTSIITTTDPSVTTTTTTTITVDTPVTSTTIKTTKCIPEVITITEKDLTTVTEKETVTVTVYEDDTPTTTPDDDSQCASKWAQCGGVGFKGPTCCQSGSTCRQLNEYYSQCV